MKRILFLFLVLLFDMPLECLAAEPPRPNIVLIISDDQGPRDYSFLNHPYIRTPHLDRLATQSLTFPRGYVTSSLCCPSLASILTGQYPHQTKITSNDPPKPPGKTGMELLRDEKYQAMRRRTTEFITQVPTIPGLLKGQGYLSYQTGKWWQGHFRTGGFTHGMSLGDPLKGGRHGDAGLAIGRESMQPIFDFMDLAQKEKKPFFVWYAPMLPHTPHNPPERILAKYRDKTKSLFEAKYAAMVEWFDETCGNLLDQLEKKGLNENTIVVYVTDNGWIQNPTGNNPIRSKLTPFEAGHRTPIMIRWPGKVKPRQVDIPVSSIDIAPTLLQALGLKPEAAMQGINLLDDVAVAKRPAVFGECFTHDAVDIENPSSSLRYRWIVEGTWRLVVPEPRNVPMGKVELYDLTSDPREENNLAEKDPARVKSLRNKLDAWWKPNT